MESSDARPFQCDKCPKAFKRKTDLGRHSLIHDPESAKHRCTFEGCNYKTRQLSNLRFHMNKHQGKQPFECTECTFRTAHPGSLLRHSRRHETKADSSHCRQQRVAKARKAAPNPNKASRSSSTPTAGPSTAGPSSLDTTPAAGEVAFVNEPSEETTGPQAASRLEHQTSHIIGLLPALEAFLEDYPQSTISSENIDMGYYAPYGVSAQTVEVGQPLGQFAMQNALYVPAGPDQSVDGYALQNEGYVSTVYNQPVEHHPGFMEPGPNMLYNEYMTLDPRAPRSLPQDTFPDMIPYWNEYPQTLLDTFERQDTDDYPHPHDDLSVDQTDLDDFMAQGRYMY